MLTYQGEKIRTQRTREVEEHLQWPSYSERSDAKLCGGGGGGWGEQMFKHMYLSPWQHTCIQV